VRALDLCDVGAGALGVDADEVRSGGPVADGDDRPARE
jgi:hypothetical protein